MKKFAIWLSGAIAAPFLSFGVIVSIGWIFHSFNFGALPSVFQWALPFAEREDVTMASAAFSLLTLVIEGLWWFSMYVESMEKEELPARLTESLSRSCDYCAKKPGKLYTLGDRDICHDCAVSAARALAPYTPHV